MEKKFELVKGVTDELKTAPSPLLLHLKRMAENPEAFEDPVTLINNEIKRIGLLITKIKPDPRFNKIEKMDFINRKIKEAFELYLSAWKHLASSFSSGDERSLYIIREEDIERLKGREEIEITDRLIEGLQELPEDKIEIIKLLKGKKYDEESLIGEFGIFEFTEEEINFILNYIKEKLPGKINDKKKIDILQLLKDKKHSERELLEKLGKLKFNNREIDLILTMTKEDLPEDGLNREKAVELGEKAEKLLKKVQKLQEELRREQAIEF